jgi:hypothetical protein
MNLTAIRRYLLSACELMHNFSARGNKTARTMLAILDASLQNLFTCVTRPLGFVYPCLSNWSHYHV